eukprot:4155385-Amphidinium_carterae.1
MRPVALEGGWSMRKPSGRWEGDLLRSCPCCHRGCRRHLPGRFALGALCPPSTSSRMELLKTALRLMVASLLTCEYLGGVIPQDVVEIRRANGTKRPVAYAEMAPALGS